MTIEDRRAPLAAARRQSASRVPGGAALWVFAAIVVFALAVGLAFAFNNRGDSAASDTADDALLAAPAQPGSEPVSQAAPAAGAPVPSTQGSDAPDVSATSAAATPSTSAGVGPSADVPETLPPPATPEGFPLLGFSVPIAGACVPESELLLPGSPRTYRNGTHEGVDFYSGAAGDCPAELVVTRATPLLAAKAGVVLRADWNYLEMTQAELDAAAAAGFQGEEILDRFRGRQIWIDHGGGVVTRYAHLGAIAAGLAVGQAVQAGQVIGFAGESGTPESVQAPGTDIHGHFEIRIGEGYLGEGLPIADARLLYLDALGLAASAAANNDVASRGGGQ